MGEGINANKKIIAENAFVIVTIRGYDCRFVCHVLLGLGSVQGFLEQLLLNLAVSPAPPLELCYLVIHQTV
ncbi:MAG: hypothetical protein Q7J35_06595 [Candidatus Methanoperedens sp.]|nr:hypothetical protein [Candidatus Methanoperedens sp.]